MTFFCSASWFLEKAGLMGTYSRYEDEATSDGFVDDVVDDVTDK